MARTVLTHPFDTMSGKLTRTDKVILRTRNGQTHAYVVQHPYNGPVAPARQRTLDAFASALPKPKPFCQTQRSVPNGNSVLTNTQPVPTAIRLPIPSLALRFAATSFPPSLTNPNRPIPNHITLLQ